MFIFKTLRFIRIKLKNSLKKQKVKIKFINIYITLFNYNK